MSTTLRLARAVRREIAYIKKFAEVSVKHFEGDHFEVSAVVADHSSRVLDR